MYLFQLSDRVLTSRRLKIPPADADCIVAGGFHSVHLGPRHRSPTKVLGRLATSFKQYRGPGPASIVTSAKIADSANLASARSLTSRQGLSSPVPFDVAPIRCATGAVSTSEKCVLDTSRPRSYQPCVRPDTHRDRVVNQKATNRGSLAKATFHTRKADAQAEALSRNSQVINAMGMQREHFALGA